MLADPIQHTGGTGANGAEEGGERGVHCRALDARDMIRFKHSRALGRRAKAQRDWMCPSTN